MRTPDGRPEDPIAALCRRLRWRRIRERLLSPDEQAHSGRVFEIVPDDPELPPLVLRFDRALTSLDEVSLAGWHAHYEGRNVYALAQGLRETRDLVRQVTSVILCEGSHGQVLGGTVANVAAPPRVLSKGTVSFRRVIFNRGTTAEIVESDLYEEQPYFWVLKADDRVPNRE